MYNQLKVELYKLKNLPLIYISTVLMVMAGILSGYLQFGNVVNTNEVFCYVVCDTSLLFLISIVSAWFVGLDFGNRTIANELKLGYSRFSVISVRMIMVYIMSITLHLSYVFAAVIGFSAANGFDVSVFSGKNAMWLITVILQLMAIESGTVMICFAARKPTGAISISVIYTFAFCNVLRNFTDSRVFTLSCFCFARNSDAGDLMACAVNALIVLTIFTVSAVLVFGKADVK